MCALTKMDYFSIKSSANSYNESVLFQFATSEAWGELICRENLRSDSPYIVCGPF